MARQKKTDPQTALMAAMMLFWREGYHGLGTRQLEQETGLTRFTLQTSYGGKKVLFLKALDTYLDMFDEVLLPPLRKGTLDDIARWMEARPIPREMHDQLCNGCLMINSITEFGRGDEEINARAERFYGMIRSAFVEGLTAACRNGDLPEDFDVAGAAEILLGCTVALNIALKSAAPGAGAPALAAASGALVRGWRRLQPTESAP